ncbi:hypothetical protein [Terriglobus aquaticus]|uniref:Uncharacterized protein n=1 Tax=Terriglobus aquaticus TaxID=940139 RepID=A0ABW9KJG6_9BACT|nr:hypothetical protein [Terriglobus aquaticus]
MLTVAESGHCGLRFGTYGFPDPLAVFRVAEIIDPLRMGCLLSVDNGVAGSQRVIFVPRRSREQVLAALLDTDVEANFRNLRLQTETLEGIYLEGYLKDDY